MRAAFQAELATIEERILAGVDLARDTLQDVVASVSDPTAPTPCSIERVAEALRASQRKLGDEIVSTIARQAPVAGDLRLVLALIEIAHHTGLIANQFDLITAQLMESDPEIPDELGTGLKLARMASLAAAELAGAASALRRRDLELARSIGAQDAAVNHLNREVFQATMLGADAEPCRELAMRHVLIARSLERIGDNAVDIAEQAVFLVTGRPCEPTDA